MDGRIRAKATVGALFLVVAASLEAAKLGPVPLQPSESHADGVTVDARTGTLGDVSLQPQLVAKPRQSDLEVAGAAEAERRFNELRRELLDDRAKTIDWWLASAAVVLTAFNLVAVVAGFLGFKEFRENRAEARKDAEASRQYAEEARSLVKEIQAQRDKVDSIMSGLTAEAVQDDPDEARRATERVRKDPQASVTDRAVAAAVQLQQQESFEESIEMWRAVAITSAESDKDLAARAWSSVGYLAQEHTKGARDEIVDAYSKAIQLDPTSVLAYNNRGIMKAALNRYEEAIEDYNQAIRLVPSDARVYSNRGVARAALGSYVEAIEDYGEAIHRNPDYAAASFNRAIEYSRLDRLDDARRDLEIARDLMRDAGDRADARTAEDALEKLNRGRSLVD